MIGVFFYERYCSDNVNAILREEKLHVTYNMYVYSGVFVVLWEFSIEAL